MKRLTLLLLSLYLCACQEKANKNSPNFTKISGEIQLLNACGVNGAAESVRKMLMQLGFDVVETGNSLEWNYPETIIALRNPKWVGADSLKKRLSSSNFIPLENPRPLVDATVFVGKDYKEWIQNVQKRITR